MATGKPFEMVFPLRGSDNTFRSFLTRVMPVFDHGGRIVRWFGTNTDITDQKKTEEALRQSEEQYRMLFTTLTEGFCIIEMLFDADERPIDYRFLEINPAFERQTGLHEAQGRLMRDLAPDHEEHWLEIYGTIALTGEPVRFENEAKVLNHWYEVSAYRVGDPESRRVAVLFNDITERKQAEEVLKTIADNLKASNQELEQFAYIASHDLKEPLRMVTCFSQILEKQYKGRLDADADEFIGYIVDGALRMEALINDLLLYSRINQGIRPVERVDMKHAIEEAVSNLIIPIRERNARITQGAMPSIQGDLSQMVQLFQNLIGNAMKYCPEEREPEIWINAERTGKDWTFSVKDNGIGIDPAYHEQIFMIFKRLHTKTEYPGTGIGLAVVKRIVGRHGGRIWIESEEGSGSTFLFTIPEKPM
jgi:PAS domain S-box-containing protein